MVLESVTLTVKLAVTLGPVGVPEIRAGAGQGQACRPRARTDENVTVPAPPSSRSPDYRLCFDTRRSVVCDWPEQQ